MLQHCQIIDMKKNVIFKILCIITFVIISAYYINLNYVNEKKYTLEGIRIEGIARFENKTDFANNKQYKIIRGEEVREILSHLDKSEMNYEIDLSNIDWTYRIIFNYHTEQAKDDYAVKEIVFMVGENGLILDGKLYTSEKLYLKGINVYEVLIQALDNLYYNDKFGEIYKLK